MTTEPAETPGQACRYCGADCSDGRSYDGAGLYACGRCSDLRAEINRQRAPSPVVSVTEPAEPADSHVVCFCGAQTQPHKPGTTPCITAAAPVPAVPAEPGDAFEAAARRIAEAADDDAFKWDGDQEMWEANREDRYYWRSLAHAALAAPALPDTGQGQGATCRQCGGPLSEARAALGLTLCSGACHIAARDAAAPVRGGEAGRALLDGTRLRADSMMLNASVAAMKGHTAGCNCMACDALAVEIATDVLAALTAAPAPAVPAEPASEDLRERIADALAAKHATYTDPDEPRDYYGYADAVLAILPAAPAPLCRLFDIPPAAPTEGDDRG